MRLEFFFDFMSPTAYLAHTQIPGIVERTGAELVRRPMYTLKLHELTGNRSPMTVPAKARWVLRDLKRFAARYGVPFALSRHHPMTMLDVAHGAMVALEDGNIEAYCAAAYPAIWAEGVDIDDRAVLGGVLAAGGLDADDILARVDAPEHHEALMANTQEAADRGAFGAPTFFVGDEMHFGQDRLDFVEAALQSQSR